VAHEAEFSLSYPAPSAARVVERSIRPEIDDIDGDRTHASLDRNGDCVTITVTASDLVALRAGLNTWLTLAGVAERSAGLLRS
jgi:KEOPS complex subunit Pcc1